MVTKYNPDPKLRSVYKDTKDPKLAALGENVKFTHDAYILATKELLAYYRESHPAKVDTNALPWG